MESCGSCEAVVEEQGQCQHDYCGYECVESGLESRVKVVPNCVALPTGPDAQSGVRQ
jgi:hypothetical protein